MVDVRTVQAGRNREDRKRANWGKWMVAAVASLAIASSTPGCGQNEDPIPTIPPVGGDGGVVTDGGAGGDGGAMDGGSCIPSTTPPCFAQSRTEVMSVGQVFVEGDFQFRLNSTREEDGEQVAKIDILDSCGALIRSVDIKENETITRDVDGTNIRLEVRAESVTVTTPQSATITARMICTGVPTDGGVTDGGNTGGDGGSGGTTDGGNTGGDGGGLVDGGMDSGSDGGSGGSDGGSGGDGGMSGDGGSTTTDGGVTDGGSEGGMDGGVTDGGSEGGADGGVIDGGGMDGGVTDGGTGGDGGAPVDGGTPDGGFIDGGSIPGSCSGTFQESRTGLWPIGVDISNGGYSFRYTGQGGVGVSYEIRCSADSALLGTVNIAESVPYVYTTSGPYRVYLTNWASSSLNSNSSINVAP